MFETSVEQRMTTLEDLVTQVWRTIDRVDRQIEQTQRHVDQLSYEMRAFKDEMGASRREMNKKWGELANKMGTMAEDLVAPSVPRILRQTVGCPDDRVESVALRVRRLHPADRSHGREFDVVAACGEYVLINETKSSLDTQAARDFAQRMPKAREFFPEYADKKFIAAIASLYVDESVVRYGEKQGLIVLGFGKDVMEVLNSSDFVPREF